MASPINNFSADELFEAAADAMLLVDVSGHIVDTNSATLNLLGYTRKELLGLEVETLIPIAFRDQHREHRNAFYKKPEKRSMGNGGDLFSLASNGEVIAVNISLSPIKKHGRINTLVTFHSAERRRKIEQALKSSEELLRLAKQTINFAIYDFNPKDLSFHCDARMYELWGGSPDTPLNYVQWLAAINAEDVAAIKAGIENASNPSKGGEYKAEYRVTNTTDHIERWVSVVGRMHFWEGQAIRMVGVVQDITEHKIFEKTLQNHREESASIIQQQIAAHTASAIAHELNQPLAAISAYSDVALHALNDATFSPEKLKRALEGSIAQSQRAGISLHELLAFLQQGDIKTEAFDLNIAVSEALNIAHVDGYKRFEPIISLEKNMPYVVANRTQILKVLVNLLTNAEDAMRGANVPNASITIAVRTNQEMNMGHVEIQDSGPGVSQDAINRIFEPFFTTKPTGIGMGLAISRALIEANGGQLWLETNFKSGASFHFTLPFAS